MALINRDGGQLDVLKCKFTHCNVLENAKRPYTIYEIEMRSSSTISWVIYKRYSDFAVLHAQLVKKSATRAADNVQFPSLPAKRLTGSLAPEFVERRKVELEEYLRGLLQLQSLRSSTTLLDFLEVPDSVRPMLLGSGNAGDNSTGDNEKTESEVKGGGMNARNFAHKTQEEKRVLELISALANNKSKVAALKSFEDYFFETRPRLTSESVRLLFQGTSDSEGGLVQNCGDYRYSQVASRAALDLLVRLLDVEKNKDAQLFLETFCSLDVKMLEKMQLHWHILSERGNKLGAFRLAATLRTKLSDSSLENIITDPYARQEYFRWADRKNDSVAPMLAEPQQGASLPESLDGGYKKIAQKAFEDILTYAHNEQGWKVVKTQRVPGPMDQAAAAAARAEAMNVRLTYKIDQRRELVVVRSTGVLPFSVDTVTTLLVDISRRKDWDCMFHRGKRVEKLDSTTDVVHFVFKSFCSPYKYRDFCLLRSWSKLESGGRILATTSILHPSVPEQKDNVRGLLYPTGYLITPLEDDQKGASNSSCLLTFVAEMDKDSVLILSSDLLGETNFIAQSYDNIRILLSNGATTTPSSSSANASAASVLSPR